MLKTLDFAKNHLKTHLLFFNYWVGGPSPAWIPVSREAILLVSEDPYQTEFILCCVDFLFH